MPTPPTDPSPTPQLFGPNPDTALAHALLRLLIGVNLLLHGLVRMPKLNAFANGVADGFAETWMPRAAALPFAYVIPFVEVVVGLMIITGLWLRAGLAASLLLMTMLTAGVCLQERWDTAGSQLVYGGILAALLFTLHHHRYGLDTVLGRRKA